MTMEPSGTFHFHATLSTEDTSTSEFLLEGVHTKTTQVPSTSFLFSEDENGLDQQGDVIPDSSDELMDSFENLEAVDPTVSLEVRSKLSSPVQRAFKHGRPSTSSTSFTIDPKVIYNALADSHTDAPPVLAIPNGSVESTGTNSRSSSSTSLSSALTGMTDQESSTEGHMIQQSVITSKDKNATRPRARNSVQVKMDKAAQHSKDSSNIPCLAPVQADSDDDLLLISNNRKELSFNQKSLATSASTVAATSVVRQEVAPKAPRVFEINSDGSQDGEARWRREIEDINAQESEEDDTYDGKATVADKWTRKAKKNAKDKFKRVEKTKSRAKGKGKANQKEDIDLPAEPTQNRKTFESDGNDMNAGVNENASAESPIIAAAPSKALQKLYRKGQEKPRKHKLSNEIIDDEDLAEDEPRPPSPNSSSKKKQHDVVQPGLSEKKQEMHVDSVEVAEAEKGEVKLKSRNMSGKRRGSASYLKTVVSSSSDEDVDADTEAAPEKLAETPQSTKSTGSRASTIQHRGSRDTERSKRQCVESPVIAVVIDNRKKSNVSAGQDTREVKVTAAKHEHTIMEQQLDDAREAPLSPKAALGEKDSNVVVSAGMPSSKSVPKQRYLQSLVSKFGGGLGVRQQGLSRNGRVPSLLNHIGLAPPKRKPLPPEPKKKPKKGEEIYSDEDQEEKQDQPEDWWEPEDYYAWDQRKRKRAKVKGELDHDVNEDTAKRKKMHLSDHPDGTQASETLSE